VNSDRASGRCAAAKRTRVRATHRPADRHSIPFLDKLFELEPQIRKRRPR
jgi:hypothetical protein